MDQQVSGWSAVSDAGLSFGIRVPSMLASGDKVPGRWLFALR